MDSPPELSPYLETNFPLPRGLKPSLEAYLEQTLNIIAILDTEIDELERALDAKRRKNAEHKELYEKHYRLQAPARNIPPEIWGIVFGFTLGDQPFGRFEYRTYGYLREVCTTWRDVLAATPNLCRGLVVHLDGPLAQSSYSEEEGITTMEDNVEAWLAIVSRNYPYHLVLSMEDEESFDEDNRVIGLYEWILTTAPTPTILTISCSEIFTEVVCLGSRSNQVTHLTLDFWEEVDRDVLDEVPFQEVFPCLTTLSINAPIQLISTMGHKNLKSLTLTKICGSPSDFALFLLEFPSLQELRIDSEEPYRDYDDNLHSFTPLIHPTLEILVAEGEDLMLLVQYITLPSLKFLGLNTWGSTYDYDELAEVIPAFFERCSLDSKNFITSFRGIPCKFFSDLFINNLPRGTRLHLDVNIDDDDETLGSYSPTSTQPRIFTEIFCDRKIDDLGWLRRDCKTSQTSENTLYMLKGVLNEEEVHAQQKGLQVWGYALKILAADRYWKLLLSHLPEMTVQWDGGRC